MSKKLDTEEFIEKARKIHGFKYDYSKVDYKDACTKICIICPEHGEFWQRPSLHLSGCGCKECGKKAASKKNTKKQEDFIKESEKVHNNKYDYSKVNYVNKKTEVCIICPIHGEFWQTPESHLYEKNGCRKCSNEKLSHERLVKTEAWIKRAKEIHGDRYSYDKTVYKGHRKKVTITCPIHGNFEQIAYNHLQGKGCPKCRKSKLEVDVSKFLEEEKIEFVEQYRPKFLNTGKSRFSLDFFLPQYNIAIECQGAQHFIGNTFYSQDIKKIIDRDLKKRKLCEENGLKVYYYTNLKKFENEAEKTYTSKTRLLNAIENERIL